MSLYDSNGNLIPTGDSGEFQLTNFHLTSRKYIDGTNGKEVDYTKDNVCATGYIPIPSNCQITLTDFAATNEYFVVGYALYSEEYGKIVYNTYNGRDEALPPYITLAVPENVKYIRFTVVNGATEMHPKLTISPLSALLNTSHEQARSNCSGFINLVDSCICIGDSVTAGDGSSGSQYNYPSQLKKLTNWTTVANVSHSGYTAKQWFDTYFAGQTYTDYEIAIIELGLNGGLTGELETDVDPYDDWEDYADTLLGNYCKIVAGIKEANPNIMIALVVSPNWDRAKNYIDKIYAVAEKYDVSVINLLGAYPALQNSRFHTSTDFLHYKDIGYFFKAKAIYREIDRCIAKSITVLPQ